MTQGGLPDAGRLLEAAAGSLKHRGPDGSGSWLSPDGSVAIGHRLLLSAGPEPVPPQPIVSASGRFVLAHSGCLYNGRELRDRLSGDGNAPEGGWRGDSDAETLLAGLQGWGVDGALRAADGSYALAAWDAHDQRLFLARDRLGENPLYVARLPDGIAFASELRALELLPGFGEEIDPGALGYFLNHGYIQAPATIYRATAKLVSGSFVSVSRADIPGLARTGDFLAPFRTFHWRLMDVVRAGREVPFRGSGEEAVEELDRVLKASVRRRLPDGVQVGAFLSGGIDSSTIAAQLRALSREPVKTFSIGFEESAFDESPHAARVAAHLGTDHSTFVLSAAKALELIGRLPEVYDEPFADASQLPTLLLAEVTRRAVRIAFGGDGGDELFGGYARYGWTETAWSKLRSIPAPVRRSVANGLRLISPAGWDRVASLVPQRVRKGLSGDRICRIAALLPAATVAELYDNFLSSGKSGPPLLLGEVPAVPPHWSGYPELPTLVETLMYRDAVDYLPDDGVVKVDRATMSVSLDARVPMLDSGVLAFAWSLPLSLKRSAGVDKITLRRLAHRYVPAELLERPKTGFGVPLGPWLRGPLRGWAEDLLSTPSLSAAGLSAEPIRRAWKAHLEGAENHHYLLWNVLMYQAWRSHRLA